MQKTTFHSILVAALMVVQLLGTASAETLEPTLSDEWIAERMRDAREAMVEAQYDRAIQTYQELVDLPEHAYRRDALELLGLVFERKGEFHRATIEYRRYIQLYPEGDGAERVKQRLAGLTTATWDEPEKLKGTKKEKESGEWRVYGALSQYVRRDVSRFEDQSDVVNQFSLTTMFDSTARQRSENFDIKSRVSASYIYDLDGDIGHEQRLSYLYVDVQQRQGDWSGRLGRQNAYGGGVLGRFDGLRLGYRIDPQYMVSVVAGLPVDSTTELTPDSSQSFYGISLETGLWNEYWEANGYFIEQEADGYVDRQAVGAELRYIHPDISFYTLVDYDIAYGTLNIFSSQGSYTDSANDTYTFILDYRNAPPILASNALIGQEVDTLSELSTLYSDAEIYALAEDRTPRSTLLMLGYLHSINEKYRWDSDISFSRLSSTPSSGGVEAVASSGVDIYLSTQLTGHHLFVKDDVHILGLSYANSEDYSTLTFFINSSVPEVRRWYFNPRLTFSVSDYDNGDSQQVIAPGLRVDYRLTKGTLIEFDSGVEWSTQKLWLGSQKSRNYFFDIGYRVDF